MIFSLNRFGKQVSPTPVGETAFYGYSTPFYKLHILETLSGLKFVMLTDLTHTIKVQTLIWIYSQLFAEYVVKNPFYEPKCKI
jgi:hypothetical protein